MIRQRLLSHASDARICPLLICLLFGPLAQASDGFRMQGGECPQQVDVQEALVALGVPLRHGMLRILESEEEVTLVWEDASGEDAQKRVLPQLEDCRERAQAVAIVLTALWSTPALPADLSADDHANVLLPGASATVPTAPESPMSLSLAAMAVADGDQLGWGGRTDVVWHRLAGNLGMAVALEATAPRSVRVGQGDVRWNRLSTMLGPAVSFNPSRQTTLVWDAMLALSLWLARGDGFALNQRNFSVAPGGSSALRVGTPLSTANAWLELRGLVWPGTRTFEVTSTDPSHVDRKALSPWELQLNLGIAFSVR